MITCQTYTVGGKHSRNLEERERDHNGARVHTESLMEEQAFSLDDKRVELGRPQERLV